MVGGTWSVGLGRWDLVGLGLVWWDLADGTWLMGLGGTWLVGLGLVWWDLDLDKVGSGVNTDERCP